MSTLEQFRTWFIAAWTIAGESTGLGALEMLTLPVAWLHTGNTHLIALLRAPVVRAEVVTRQCAGRTKRSTWEIAKVTTH